ncbi:stage II sporulation protein M [Natrialbaceae archaeon AArc-T1-2]|uniref:stage II sporulation protein M n=1 Tax=Natrialbaceae archaeon AArc-T1-2 TaxID=3053904 RepID=UPI00255AC0AA|nr:stage II sporulation protein M [Natrialbaceae archaeon AArc-T1-2]WIV66182.1 stage II sporulation protein M [Natrialbaceae archaeon AArc-T1-2]
MRLSRAVSAVVATLRQRPAGLLPVYVFGAAVPAIARVVPFLGVAVAAFYLETTGRLETVRTELIAQDLEPPDPETDPDAFADWIDGLEPVLEALFPTPVVAIAAVTTAIAALVAFVLYAVVGAAQLAACDGRLRDERGLVAALAGARRHWLTFLGLYVLEIVLWLTAAVVIGAATALTAGVVAAATGEQLLAVPVVLLGGLVWLVVVAVVRALFAFAPVAVVVDTVGVFASVTRSAGFVRRRPVPAAFYYVVSIGVLVGVTTALSTLAFVGAESVASLLVLLLVLPALDLLKTVLYGDYRGTVAPPSMPESSLRTQFVRGLRRGWDELWAFVRATPGLHALALALIGGGFWLGWAAAEPFVDVVPTSIEARLEGHIPPAATAEFFANNWTVALSTAYSGFALAIPAAVALLFNGVVIGAIARLEVDLEALIAFVVPHGIVEIPAILVAGALGFHLGVVGWRAVRGRIDRPTLADELERAFWVLVGVGLLLALAAVIEGFVSPYYFRLFV